jgi:hypothetical protein
LVTGFTTAQEAWYIVLTSGLFISPSPSFPPLLFFLFLAVFPSLSLSLFLSLCVRV